MDFWYLRISRRATVPGLKRWGFLTPPEAGADLRAALVARALRGALPPVDLRAVCLVRAMAVDFAGLNTGFPYIRVHLKKDREGSYFRRNSFKDSGPGQAGARTSGTAKKNFATPGNAILTTRLADSELVGRAGSWGRRETWILSPCCLYLNDIGSYLK